MNSIVDTEHKITSKNTSKSDYDLNSDLDMIINEIKLLDGREAIDKEKQQHEINSIRLEV